MPETTISTSYLDRDIGGSIVTVQGEPFDPEAYSRMKYGSQLHSERYGLMLGEAIMQHAPDLIEDASPLTALMIYKTVPSAATNITRAAMVPINEARVSLGMSTVEPVHVKMQRVLGIDYSTLSNQGRQQYITDTGYRLHPEEVQGTNTILIDDIRITGSAEILGRSLLETADPRSLLLGYIAVMNPAAAKVDPAIEKRINISAVESLEDMLDIAENDGMIVTLRGMKRLLEEPDEEAIRSFLHAIPRSTLFDFYSGALSSGGEYVAQYQDNFAVLQDIYSRSKDSARVII